MQTLSFVPKICIDAGHVSENTLLNKSLEHSDGELDTSTAF